MLTINTSCQVINEQYTLICQYIIYVYIYISELHSPLREIVSEHNWKPSSDHYTFTLSKRECPYICPKEANEIEMELIDSHNPKFLMTNIIPEEGMCMYIFSNSKHKYIKHNITFYI